MSRTSCTRFAHPLALAALVGMRCASATSDSSGGRAAIATAPTYTSTLSDSSAPPSDLQPLYDAARAGATSAGRTLQPDNSLAGVARSVVARVAHDPQLRTPSVAVLQALCWSTGVIDPVPGVIVTQMSAGAPTDVFSHAVADLVHDGPFNIVGIAVAPGANGSRVAVAVIAQRRLTLSDPVPRRVAAGALVRLNGRFADGLQNGEIAITHPDHTAEHFPVAAGPDFVTQFPVPTRGRYQVEIIADSEAGSTVLANFPVYVDTDPPAVGNEVETTQTEAPSAAETELLRLVNDARHGVGKPPLQLMPTLAVVARAHSVDMATHHFIGHTSPTTGTQADRVHRAGLQSAVVLENIGTGHDAREIHDGLMASPGHYANVISDHVTHIGIGAAPQPGAGGGLIVTEDFIEIGAAVDLTTAPTTLLDRLNDARTRRGAPQLVARPQLGEVAMDAAREFFQNAHETQQQVVAAANHRVNRFGLIFRRVDVLAVVVSHVADAGALEPLLDPAIGSVGIGIAQGTRADTAPNAIFVVFVLGYPRGS